MRNNLLKGGKLYTVQELEPNPYHHWGTDGPSAIFDSVQVIAYHSGDQFMYLGRKEQISLIEQDNHNRGLSYKRYYYSFLDPRGKVSYLHSKTISKLFNISVPPYKLIRGKEKR